MSAIAPVARGAGNTSAGVIFDVVRRGIACSRGEIARWSGLAPSTVSLRVEGLIRAGLLEETGAPGRRTGRTPRTLSVRADGGLVASAVINASRVDIALADFRGQVRLQSSLEIETRDGPHVVLAAIWTRIEDLVREAGSSWRTVAGLALGLPAPVDPNRGTVAASAQLPGWERVDLAAELRRHSGIPILLENDANLLAVAEYERAPSSVRNLLAVKVGDRIGAGIIAAGALFTGTRGAAGEIGHSPTSAPSVVDCTCAHKGCLESVASGHALVSRLQREGYDVAGTADLAPLSGTGDPRVVGALREAGGLVGERLAEFVNFLNPDSVVLGGGLAVIPVYAGAIRAEVFRSCLPVVADALDLRVGEAGEHAETTGGAKLILDRILDVDAINELVAKSDEPHPS
ncbi:ROK family protein [Amycolatopsis sp. GM8]|uniref:ROK family protein n=1 Tax=Amycolatopsis sp. GM8 TaxID=2896530 RepID=UPI001F29E0EE|nr:ROK family protein [Amycolatopsis sp. GM8]